MDKLIKRLKEIKNAYHIGKCLKQGCEGVQNQNPIYTTCTICGKRLHTTDYLEALLLVINQL
jgi:hypothetical protein